MVKSNFKNNDDAIHQSFIAIGNYLYNHGNLIDANDKLLEILKALMVIPINKKFEEQRKRTLRILYTDVQQLKHKVPIPLNFKNQYENLYNNILETYLWVIDIREEH